MATKSDKRAAGEAAAELQRLESVESGLRAQGNDQKRRQAARDAALKRAKNEQLRQDAVLAKAKRKIEEKQALQKLTNAFHNRAV